MYLLTWLLTYLLWQKTVYVYRVPLNKNKISEFRVDLMSLLCVCVCSVLWCTMVMYWSTKANVSQWTLHFHAILLLLTIITQHYVISMFHCFICVTCHFLHISVYCISFGFLLLLLCSGMLATYMLSSCLFIRPSVCHKPVLYLNC